MRLTRGGALDGEHRDALHRPSFGQQGLRPRPAAYGFELDFMARARRGERPDGERVHEEGRLLGGQVHGADRSPMVADNTSPGRSTAVVVASRPGQDRLQGQDDLGHAATMYTKFCNVPKQRAEHLPERRLAEGLPRPQTILDPTFNGKNIVPVEQLELAAAQRSRASTSRSRQGRDDRQPNPPLRRLGTHRRRGREDRSGGPVAVGELPVRSTRRA